MEEEGPSYLNDLNKVPDYLDEEPVESVGEVTQTLPVLFEVAEFIHKQASSQPEAIRNTA